MAEIVRTSVVAAGPEEVWAVLADFAALAAWADGVDHSCLLNGDGHAQPVGLVRRVQAGRDTFAETILAFDPPRLLAYDVAGVPRGFTVTNRWNLAAATGVATTVTLTSSVTMASRLLRPLGERALLRMMARRSEALLGSLANTLGGTV